MLFERYNFLHFKPIKIAVSIHFQRVAMEERQRLVLGQKRKYTASAEKGVGSMFFFLKIFRLWTILLIFQKRFNLQ